VPKDQRLPSGSRALYSREPSQPVLVMGAEHQDAAADGELGVADSAGVATKMF
jgi:hypothetical protein